MVSELLDKYYGLKTISIKKSSVGAGSDTYFVECWDGKYILKFPSVNEMNNPDIEPDICNYLLKKGLSVSEFIINKSNEYISMDSDGRRFHLQKFVDGNTYDLNCAPDWLLTESAQILGKIHTALTEFSGLAEGIGKNFFKYMTPQSALKSYEDTLNIAIKNNDTNAIDDIKYRIGLMKRFPEYSFDLDKLSLKNTHGDYFISQIICGSNKINAVIDWTTACIHPVIWEIIRSYTYASEKCINGEIDIPEFINYVKEYMKYSELNKYDLENMAKLFYYQIAVCDYYRQYYFSTADNRGIYLNQAVFATKLMKWFEENIDNLTEALLSC